MRLEEESYDHIKRDISWEMRVAKLAKEQFPKVKQMYEAHRLIELFLTLMKIEHEKNMKSLMPRCHLEEIGGYIFLTQAHIKGEKPTY